MKVTIEEWQTQLDGFDNQVKEIKDRKDIIIKALESTKGLDYVKGKLVKREVVYGVFYDISYYSHFDGHASEAVYYDESGAEQITEENFQSLKAWVERYQENKDNSDEFWEEIFGFINFESDYFLYSYSPKDFKIVDDTTILWEYKGTNDQCEVCDDSTVEFKLSTESAIKKVRRKRKKYS